MILRVSPKIYERIICEGKMPVARGSIPGKSSKFGTSVLGLRISDLATVRRSRLPREYVSFRLLQCYWQRLPSVKGIASPAQVRFQSGYSSFESIRDFHIHRNDKNAGHFCRLLQTVFGGGRQ